MRQLFDDKYPEHEQLPRILSVHVREVYDAGVVQALVTLDDGRQFGDCVTDDSDPPDGYRFHDAFHLGCAALLGWSPVTRRNLQRKRRSNRTVDRVEDGGRACALEEGISQLVFLYAKTAHFFEGVHRLDSGLVSLIKGLTSHLEVSVRSEEDWEHAILTSYGVFRELLKHKGGRIKLDLLNKLYHYEPQ